MKISRATETTEPAVKRLEQLSQELQQLEAQLRLGGGTDKIERQHKTGKHTACERIELLLDTESYYIEVGLMVAYDKYKKQAGKGNGEAGIEVGAAPAA